MCEKLLNVPKSRKEKKTEHAANNYDRTLSSNCMYTHICSVTSIQPLCDMMKKNKVVATAVSDVWLATPPQTSVIS